MICVCLGCIVACLLVVVELIFGFDLICFIICAELFDVDLWECLTVGFVLVFYDFALIGFDLV